MQKIWSSWVFSGKWECLRVAGSLATRRGLGRPEKGLQRSTDELRKELELYRLGRV